MNRKRMSILDKLDRFGLWLLVIALAFLVGCSPTATGGESEESEAEDTAEMYAAVIRQIYTVDDTFGGTLQAPTLYLVRTINDTASDPATEQSEPVVLSEEVQAAITSQLADLPTELIWVDTFEDVTLNPDMGEVPDGGAIIQLGNIHPQDDGSAQVSGSIYVANLAAGGKTYVLEQSDGNWEVTGTTGVEWIS
jgi:hypothetical protein